MAARTTAHLLVLTLVALATANTGCAPRRFTDGVAWEIQRSATTNAACQLVRGHPSLRLNAFLLDQLHQIDSILDVVRARRELNATIDDAFAQSHYTFNNEIDRLSETSLQSLWRRYWPTKPPSSELRELIRNRFWKEAEGDHGRLRAAVAATACREDVEEMARQLSSAALPSPKDRRGRGLLLALVAASIEVPSGPLERGGPQFDRYSPIPTPETTDNALDPHMNLLRQFAPVIVQERLPSAPYPPDTDTIGSVELRGTEEHTEVRITQAPCVFGYVQDTWINGHEYPQLTYTHWYPRHRTIQREGQVQCASCEHTAIKAIDSEAGAVDGAILRITLDRHGRPAVFETVMTCGCYHRCYVASYIEDQACKELGQPEAGKTYCVEQHVDGKFDWIVPEIIDVPNQAGHPFLFCLAGQHTLAGVSFDEGELAVSRIIEDKQYMLQPYENLELLPLGSGYGSMFDANGLVHGAERLEGALLALTGMRSAGQPRQRGTQLLHWDQYDFDDPHLLEKCLRLPRDF